MILLMLVMAVWLSRTTWMGKLAETTCRNPAGSALWRRHKELGRCAVSKSSGVVKFCKRIVGESAVSQYSTG